MSIVKENKPVVFRTRYSVILLIVVLIPAFVMLYLYFNNPRTALLAGLIVIFTCIILFSGIKYAVFRDKLQFFTWFIFSGEIDINSIEKIERTYIPLAANAASFKRLHLILKKGSRYPYLIISPINEDIFFAKSKICKPKYYY